VFALTVKQKKICAIFTLSYRVTARIGSIREDTGGCRAVNHNALSLWILLLFLVCSTLQSI
jgi:hypothetical protein